MTRSKELEQRCRSVADQYGHRKTWIASATNDEKEEYLKTLIPPYEKTPDAATPASPDNVAAAIQNTITQAVTNAASQAVNEERVKEIVATVLRRGVELDEADIQRIAKEATKHLPIERVIMEPAQTEIPLDSAHSKFPRLLAHLAAMNNVALIGPSGTGKTYAAYLAAKALNAKLFIQPPCLQRYDITGYERLDGTISSTPTADWARYEGNAIILYDEIDAFAPTAQISANLILDGGVAPLPDGTFPVYGKDNQYHKVAIASSNTDLHGSTAQNSARHPVDRALQDRFPTRLDWNLDDSLERAIIQQAYRRRHDDEKSADTVSKAVVKVMNNLRDYIETQGIQTQISTRSGAAAASELAVKVKSDGRIDFIETIEETMILHFKAGTQQSGARDASGAATHCSTIDRMGAK